MAGHSILYLGREDFASDFLARLETLPVCGQLSRSADPCRLPGPGVNVDLVLLDVESASAARPLLSLLHALRHLPVVALTRKADEQRGIVAVNAGAEACICIDDVATGSEQAIFDHAVKRHGIERRLSETDVSILSVLNNINDGLLVVDRRGNVVDINPAARTILGLGPRALPDPSWEQTFCCLDEHGQAWPDAGHLPLVRARNGEKFSGQVALYRSPDQPDVLLCLNGQGLYDGNHDLVGGVVTFRDVTDTARRAAELSRRAQYDELTGLPNRSLFTEYLSRALGRAGRKSGLLAVLFLDLDRFRSVNDALGYDGGDTLLCEVSARLRKHLRVGDFCGRWGGDQFVVCLEDFGDVTNAAAAAQKLLLVLSERYDVGAGELYVTPSIGIAVWPESGNDAERLVKAADVAMLEAKKRGGGRFQFYSPAMNQRLAQREELEMGLRHALVRNEFALHYQPRIDLASNRLIGLEALLRWQHPRYGLLPPARFLAILESTGLIHSSGEWVIATACRQLAAWQRQFEMPDLSIAINISPLQLRHQRLIETVANALADSALDAGCLELEIGDGDVIRKRDVETATLKGLRKLGVRLSLDHFGTRDVSFDALDNGFIDSFVLDPSLIEDIADNGSHRRIVRAAIAMAQGLDIEVAAEGVETLSQLELLKELNCDLAQGFLIGRPMQPDKVPAVLRSEIAGKHLVRQPQGQLV